MRRSSDPPVRAIATVTCPHSARHYEGTLPNGAPVMLHIHRGDESLVGPLSPGDQVPVALTPYDFSHARIEGPPLSRSSHASHS